MMVSSSLTGAPAGGSGSRAVTAALMDVSGVLNSWAIASSSELFSSWFCRAASACPSSWRLRARSKAMAARFATACSAASETPAPWTAMLPSVCPPRLMGWTEIPAAASWNTVPWSAASRSRLSLTRRSCGPERQAFPVDRSNTATACAPNTWATWLATCWATSACPSVIISERLNEYSRSISSRRASASMVLRRARAERWLEMAAVSRKATSATQFCGSAIVSVPMGGRK